MPDRDIDVATRELAERWTLAVYTAGTWTENSWLGFRILQLPNDLMIMQQLIVRTKPTVIIETGTFQGGSAIFYASILSLIGGGKVISLDVAKNEKVWNRIKEHPLGDQITLISGDSVHPDTLGRVSDALDGETNIMVALDSDHSYEHVLGELRAYWEFVPPGGYLVVFDTILEAINRLPSQDGDPSDSPKRAVEEFLKQHAEFEVDASSDRLLASFCPGGFLKRVR